MEFLIIFISFFIVISAMAQENDCAEMNLQIESSADLDWEICFVEKEMTLKINTLSEQPTENQIILQKDTFWNYHFDCSPREFQSFLNDEYINFKEEYFDDYRILYASLDKGYNEILIGIPTIPPNVANDICSGIDKNDPLPRSLSLLLNNNERPSLKEQIQKNTPLHDLICKTYMILIMRPDQSDVACVTNNTSEKLLVRGWLLPNV